MISVVVVDDHAVFREGLRALLARVAPRGVDVERIRAELVGHDEHVLGPRLGLRRCGCGQHTEGSGAGDEVAAVHAGFLCQV